MLHLSFHATKIGIEQYKKCYKDMKTTKMYFTLLKSYDVIMTSE